MITMFTVMNAVGFLTFLTDKVDISSFYTNPMNKKRNTDKNIAYIWQFKKLNK